MKIDFKTKDSWLWLFYNTKTVLSGMFNEQKYKQYFFFKSGHIEHKNWTTNINLVKTTY